MTMTTSMPVLDASHAAERRRQISAMARRLGFDENDTAKIAVAVTEIATNLVKHAGEGELLVRPIAELTHIGLEILAIDKGPGIADIPRSMSDGYSTAGSPGTGMGAIERMADQFDMYSSPTGTVLMARFWSGGSPPPSTSAFEIEGVAVPKRGEEMCGDDWTCHHFDDRLMVVVADGLGHGELAAQASAEATRVFTENAEDAPEELLAEIHGALRSTRGAAAAIARIDRAAGIVGYTGIGNIAGTILSPEKTYRMISHNGIVGHETRKIQEFIYPWSPGSTLLMHSDGLMTQWSLDPYPGLMAHHLSVVAGILYRDFSRGRDDTTVVAAREIG